MNIHIRPVWYMMEMIVINWNVDISRISIKFIILIFVLVLATIDEGVRVWSRGIFVIN